MNEFNIRQIGQRIASKRRELNMTQSNLADQLLVSYQAISNWERGNTLPDIEKLPQLATIFQLSIDELLGNSGVAVMHYHEESPILRKSPRWRRSLNLKNWQLRLKPSL